MHRALREIVRKDRPCAAAVLADGNCGMFSHKVRGGGKIRQHVRWVTVPQIELGAPVKLQGRPVHAGIEDADFIESKIPIHEVAAQCMEAQG